MYFGFSHEIETYHAAAARAVGRTLKLFPKPLSAIIMKLLAKNAEECYQTALGLEADLRKHQSGNVGSEPIELLWITLKPCDAGPAKN